MSELSSTTDAPPPPPPPPPPEIESREPDASPELAQALSGENQDANQTGFDTGGQDDAARMAQAQEQADPIREQLQEYQQDNAVDGGPPDVSPELAGALPDESELTADDSDDPVRQRKTWEDNAEGSDLPPSMKEDLRDLGNDLKEIIDPAAWEKKTDPDARKDMLNAANDRIREEYGLPQRDVSYRSAAEDPDLAGAYGYFDPETGGVVINSDYLGDPDPKEAIKTLAHENFHAYQDRAQYGDCSDPFGQSRAAEWQEADAQYPHEEDFDSLEDYKEAYLNNLLEKDARAVESEVYTGYREDRR